MPHSRHVCVKTTMSAAMPVCTSQTSHAMHAHQRTHLPRARPFALSCLCLQLAPHHSCAPASASSQTPHVLRRLHSQRMSGSQTTTTRGNAGIRRLATQSKYTTNAFILKWSKISDRMQAVTGMACLPGKKSRPIAKDRRMESNGDGYSPGCRPRCG